MKFLEISRGNSPVILAMPHAGTDLPDDVRESLNERGRSLADTDWHINYLYDKLLPNTTIIGTKIHRYAIDVNRDPTGVSLYPGQNTTSLVPLTDFDGANIWSRTPTIAEISVRLNDYHAPYHATLKAEIKRIRAIHGYVILYDCHSIRSRIPYLFDGYLPDFNIGTNQSTTSDPKIEQCVVDICGKTSGYTSVCNGRFKGGWTVRHYGQPTKGVHAIQMELAQRAYLEDEVPPWTYSTAKANRLRVELKKVLMTLGNWRPH